MLYYENVESDDEDFEYFLGMAVGKIRSIEASVVDLIKILEELENFDKEQLTLNKNKKISFKGLLAKKTAEIESLMDFLKKNEKEMNSLIEKKEELGEWLK